MDCVSSVLQTSSCSENFPIKSNQKEFNDDIWIGNFNDDELIDEFLDFSKEEVGGEDFGFSFCALEKGLLDGLSDENSNSIFSVKEEEFDGVPQSRLSGPEEDLTNLERISRFLEEPSSEFPSSARIPICKNNLDQDENQTSDLTFKNSRGFSWEITVPVKARSKRQRCINQIWPQTQLTEPTSCSSSSPSVSSSGSFTSTPLSRSLTLVYVAGKHPPAKKQNKWRKAATENVQRHCSHCLVQKTPQWRTGPLGAKTLCNACGVRYKSGRLYPEYRPAGSPTFSSEVHSNHHRKVLEMRRLKETNQTESHSQAIQSF